MRVRLREGLARGGPVRVRLREGLARGGPVRVRLREELARLRAQELFCGRLWLQAQGRKVRYGFEPARVHLDHDLYWRRRFFFLLYLVLGPEPWASRAVLQWHIYVLRLGALVAERRRSRPRVRVDGVVSVYQKSDESGAAR